MPRWYSRYYCILIFGIIIWLNDVPSTFALSIDQDQHRIEYSLHDFMVKKNSKAISMENVSSLGKRLVRKFSICGLSVPRKLNLCKRALTEEDQFEEEFKTYECKPRKFQYTFHFDDVKKHPKISMYKCPKLLRRDQRTGSLVSDDRQLFISRMSSGIEQAMVYKREHEEGMLQPTRHLFDITKDDLDTEPPISQEIRSRDRFKGTPVRSARNSPSPTASSIRNSPQFGSAENSPHQMSPTRVSSQMTPTHSGETKQSPGRNILSGITSSAFFSPLVRIPANVSPGTSYSRKKSTTSTPSSSPQHSKSRPATPVSGSGKSTPYYSPSLSPVNPNVGVGTRTQRRRRPPQGIILSDTVDSSRPSSASASGYSTDDGGGVMDRTKQDVLGSSRFAGATSIEDDTVADRRKATGFTLQPSHPRQIYRHKNFNRDRAYHSENNSPPNEEAEFQGFMTPVPAGTSVADMLGNSPSPGSVIQRTQSEHALGPHDDQNIIYPLWPRRQKGPTKSSQEDSAEDDSSASIPPQKSTGPVSREEIISQWKEHRKKTKTKSGVSKKYSREITAGEEENKAEEDISEAPALDVLGAYDENLDRHRTNKPTVLTDFSKRSLHQLFQQEHSEESNVDFADASASGYMADSSASESLSAMKDLSVQSNLSDKKHFLVQGDSLGDTDMPIEKVEPQEGTSSTIFHAAAAHPFGEVSEERTARKSGDTSTGSWEHQSTSGAKDGES